ncbi:zf-CCHC domain-containing protein [Tanacetum coccineum]
MCDTAQNIWDSLITTHQGNKQVKDNKIDLFVQKYEEFTITDDETIDCAFSRFNTIITSLKALDESFSSRNHVRKFLRALPSKWRPKVTAIEESKDLSKLSLDELVGNLKVYEVVLEKDLEIAKNKKEKYKSLALKARQVLSDDDTSSSDSNDEEYAMAVRDFKKFFRRRGKFVRQPYDDKRNFRKIKEDKKEDRRCFKCGDPNHFISDCPKNSSGDQKAFVVGSWSDSGDDSKKEEICLMAHSNEVLSDNLYYSSSSLDNESRQNEYDKLCQISLRIINKNKHLKAKNESLKKTINEHKTKLDILEKGKETSSNCDACNELRLEVNSLKLKLASFENSSSSLQKMVEMQKPSKDKCGLGYTETIASPRNTKIKNLGGHLKKLSVEPAGRCHSSTAPACSIEQHRVSDDSAEKEKDLETNVRHKVKLDPDEWIQDSGCTRHMTGNKDLFLSYKTFDGGNVLFGSNTKSKIIGKGNSHLGLWYPKGTGLETIVYADSDHAGDFVDRKSTSGVCTFIGCCLTSWMSKKQTALAISTTKAEYVSLGKAFQQALWMKQALVDYKVKLNDIPILCDNKGAIDLNKNPIIHSRTKHIEIRHHFLRDNVQKGNISIEKVASEDNISDILTKPLKREPFNLLRLGLELIEPNV